MKALEDLKEILEDELKKISKKGDINPTELEAVYKATDILKDIETIKAMKEAGGEEGYAQEGGYSQRRGYSRNGGYSSGYSMEPIWNQSPMSYDGGMSNRGGMSYRGNSYNDSSYNHGGSYDGGASYEGDSYDGRAGRDGDSDGQYSERRGRGRYSRDGSSYRGYSRHTEKEHMIKKLESMLKTASTEKERMAIEDCITQLED